MTDKPEDLIPDGMYCYKLISVDPATGKSKIKPCPFWSLRTDKPYQENGYCAYLKRGDWEDGIGILWDQVKVCGIKKDWTEDES